MVSNVFAEGLSRTELNRRLYPKLSNITLLSFVYDDIGKLSSNDAHFVGEQFTNWKAQD